MDSGGAGQFRGGLGQVMEIGTRTGHAFDLSAMFDRVDHPARGRDGGGDGAPTTLARSDASSMKGKGRQAVPDGQTVHLAFPGGGGIGHARDRDRAAVRRDLRLGYISDDAARKVYGLTDADLADGTDAHDE